MIILGNVLVVVAIALERSLAGTQNWFITSLAVSDILVGLFIMPLSLTNELLGYWPFGSLLCDLWLSTDVLLCTASILNLVLISVDRYCSITKAVSYAQFRTRRRAMAMIGVVWALSAVICFPPLAGWKRPQPVRDDGLDQCVLSQEHDNIHTYIHTHIHTHIHTYTQLKSFLYRWSCGHSAFNNLYRHLNIKNPNVCGLTVHRLRDSTIQITTV